MNPLLGLLGKRALCALVVFLAINKTYAATVVTAEVNGADNLFFTPWGHAYTLEFDAPPPGSVCQPIDCPLEFGIGAGIAARAVGVGGAFDFSGFDFVDVTATGSVVDFNVFATDSDGVPLDPGVPPISDPVFRKLRIYSLVGIWSSDPATIVPIGSIGPESEPAFNIGSSARLVVPQGIPAYLFLANNDGVFTDNSGSYAVQLRADVQAVPLPGAAGLMLSGLAVVRLRARRRR